MPTPESILSWATSVANEWRWLAIFWHVALAVALLTGLTWSRMSQRSVAFLCVLPIASVAVVAWVSGNPFNGTLFTLLTLVLSRAAANVPGEVAFTSVSWPWRLAGVGLVGVGWLYPHFLITDTSLTYAYASPFGVLPCPTLSVVIGLMLAVGGLRSADWNVALTAAGLLYGWIGVFRLGVLLDGWLLGGALVLAARVAANQFRLSVIRQP
jgi:hypothetical protein